MPNPPGISPTLNAYNDGIEKTGRYNKSLEDW